ncbi:MAG: signal peptidase I [Treponema sp.]
MVTFFALCPLVSLVFSLLLLVHNLRPLAVIGAGFGIVFSVLLAASFFTLKRKNTYRFLLLTRKLYEYWAFALIASFICSRALAAQSPKLLDTILAILWFGIVALTQGALYFLKDKRLAAAFPLMTLPPKRKKSFMVECIEWVDAALYAIFFVVLTNIFVVQMYRIPSESMVPEFMIGDTVIGFKTSAGPVFPLSSFRLPQWRSYKRGDIVILHNPNYPDTPKARLKTFMSQLVYMLTFAQVNLNTDDYGRQKADPLVKRITGLPGEKLMMVDGVLYVKRAEDSDFSSVEDERRYAQWNLSALPQSELQLVKDIKISKEELAVMERIESVRKTVDFSEAARTIHALINRLAVLKHNTDTAKGDDFLQNAEYELITLFTKNDAISRTIATTNGGLDWFTSFMTSATAFWHQAEHTQASLYEKRFAQLNILIKLCFGKLIVRNIELFNAQATSMAFRDDPTRNALLREAQEYAFYLTWTNQRNMPVFPAAEGQYIPESCYFMMGDNRFNSTDMRHAYYFHLAPVDIHDEKAILFQSNSNPKYVSSEKILGTTVFRVFPFSRFGAL